MMNGTMVVAGGKMVGMLMADTDGKRAGGEEVGRGR